MKESNDVLGRTETAVCQKQIDALIQAHAEVVGALVSTIDGFEVAAMMPKALSAAKLSAMTSSLLALGEAICSDSNAGRCIDIVIDASGGRILMMDIPHATRKLLLTVLCKSGATLGQVLWAVRDCRQKLSLRLNAKF